MGINLACRAALFVIGSLGTSFMFGQTSASVDHGSAPPTNCSSLDRNCQESWEGSRTTGDKSQSIVLHVAFRDAQGSGTVDLPGFGALAIPAAKFAMDHGRIHFELVGDTSNAVFEGNLIGGAMRGTWKEDDHAGRFELKRKHEGGRDFREEDVFFKNGDVRLAGTFLIPLKPVPAPAIVFVQGAGPETRQASRFLAEFFVKRGVAALIYDKRGAGVSSGEWKHSSFANLAADVAASVAFLKSRPEVDPKRIGLMGSSQGGWIAPMAAVSVPDLAFVIVKSAAAVTPEEQELARVEKQMRAEGDSPADVTEALALYQHAIAYARSGEGWSSLAWEIAADSQKKWTLFDADTPKDYWFFDQIRLTFDHDPIPVLKKVTAPLLVVFGGEDEDAPSLQPSLDRLLHAMHSGGKTAELEIFPAADHTLRVQPTKGQEWDFRRFAPGYLESLASWVKLETQ